jgi:hypothetical protein
MDPWINIPVSADSLYIVNVAKLFKDNLSQSLHIYVESSNEVWNTAPGFEQSLYSQAEAKALGIGEHENHARRTVQIAKIFSQVYGENSLNNKVRIILCSHKPMLKWWVVPMLSYISKKFGPPKNFIYGVACQTYFGGGTTAGISVDKLLSNCHSEIAGQIDETGGTDEAGRVQWIKTAKDSGLVGGFCSYEGGPDHGGGSTDNLTNRITAERDPRMGAIWTYNMDTAFFKIGGNLAMQFTLSSAYCRYGCWGLTDDITKLNRNAKYKAAQDVAAKYASPVHRPDIQTTTSKKQSMTILNSTKTIRIFYTLERQGDITIDLWNIKGQRILQRHFPNQVAGSQEFTLGVSGTGMENISNTYLIATITTDKMTEKCGAVLLRK